MNIGNEIRDRHLAYVLHGLNMIIPDIKFELWK